MGGATGRRSPTRVLSLLCVLGPLDGHVGLHCSSKCLTWAVAKVLYMAQLPAVEPVFDQDVRIHGTKIHKWKGLDQNLMNTRLFLTISRKRRRTRTETTPPMIVPKMSFQSKTPLGR